MSPKISVVMPVWNGEMHLANALDSILAQTFSDFELIAVDDGSSDGTPDILRSYQDERLRIHRLNHGGIVTALNFGVAQSRAEWIARQDADDISQPERFAAQMKAVQARPDAILSYTDVALIGEDARGIKHARFPRTKAFLALRLCYQNPIVHSTVLFRKDAFLRAGGYVPEERHAEDFALWGRMLELGDFVGLTNRLLHLRVHPQSVSKGNSGRQNALATEIAIEHCQRFLRLPADDARRACGILSQPPGERSGLDWRWFLQRCAPRLRWKSNEFRAWLIFQTLKQFRPS
jgi:glycosyltransferase involved in cell wall biosynthesis